MSDFEESSSEIPEPDQTTEGMIDRLLYENEQRQNRA
jgi:hypothetical protein